MNRLRNTVATFIAAWVLCLCSDGYVDTFVSVLEAGQDALDVKLGSREVMRS